MKVLDFVLENDEKVNRAVEGSMTRQGALVNGIGKFEVKPPVVVDGKEVKLSEKEQKEAYDKLLLAHYDKLGGYITKDGVKVKTGSFYDFKNKTPRFAPELTFIAEVEGELIEVTEDEAKAIKVAKKKTSDIKSKKIKK